MSLPAISSLRAAGFGDLASIPIQDLAANKALSEDQKIGEACRQFEAVMLRQILGQARQTVFHSKFNEDSTTSGIYQDMVTGQLADAISRNGSFGLARSLQAQLVHPPAGVSQPDSNKP
jgi:Rod binding domain-containing protein